MIKLLRFIKPYRTRAALAPFAKLIETVSELFMPLVMAALIDNGIGGKDVRYVLVCAGILTFLALFGFSACLCCQYLAAVASMGMGAGIRRALHQKIDALTVGDLDKFGASSLVTRSVNDTAQVQQAVAMFIRLILRAPLLAAGGIVMLLVLDARLALITTVFVPLFALALWLVLRKSLPAYKKAQKQLDGVSRSISENLNGVRAVRAFNRTEHERGRFAALNGQYRGTATRAALYAALLSPLTQLIMNLAVAAVLWYSGYNPAGDVISAGSLIAFINYLTQIMLALNIAANLAPVLLRATASAQRINEVLDLTPSGNSGHFSLSQPVTDCPSKENSPTEKEKSVGVLDGDTAEVLDMGGALQEKAAEFFNRDTAEVLDQNAGGAFHENKENAPALEFRNVSFSYDGKHEILSGINFTVKKGGVFGVIGGTGAGKSTLAALILRLHDCGGGDILADGADIRAWDLAALRGRIGFVPQKAALFQGTIADNLRVGKEGATEAEMRAACETAQAWEFVSGLGWDAPVAQGGKNFSGGQRQRLTIARALVRRPSVLILDDSASALDYATDYKLRAALKRLKGMTVVIVSQRVASVRGADQILALDGGKAAGLGTHKELLAACGLYREICASQGTG
ncbi:MAG: ABC transporter ATP-binding protein/permease [Clostridiales bacterium]|nr:ABC transporter ATP-binding protein/permease [Clostridiales bacterium]